MEAANYQAIYWVILLPLLGALFQTLVGKAMVQRSPGLGKLVSGGVAVGTVLAGFGIGLFHHLRLINDPGSVKAATITYFDWINLAQLHIPVELRFDALSSTMVLVITGIGGLIHIYATRYMAEDKDFTRFFAYLNLFVAMMLILVLGNNLALLFVGWEGVGVCSYLLIGFWHKDLANSRAANKAFITNRIGDVGLALGMFWLVALIGGNREVLGLTDARWLSYDVLIPAASQLLSQFPHETFWISLLLFVGAMGKSAQFPLYVWLPDAMAGPTPVSALIHAATMVTSGVVLLNRVSEIIALSPAAMSIIAGVGAITALLGAIMAWGQTDIKKVLAYSTVSQLGYMFIACGVGVFYAGMFHVVTHAFFKALLFLGSGSVIYAMAHNQDMRNYGGLGKKLKITYVIMGIGYLALAGLPFAFSGFWSKEAILGPAVNDTATLPLVGGLTVGAVAGWVGFLVAFMTAFYMTRMMCLTFGGKTERWREIEPAHHDDHGHDHGHAHGHAHDDDHGHEMDPAFFMTEEEAHAAAGHDDHHHHDLDKTHEPKEVPWLMWAPLIPMAIASFGLIGVWMYGDVWKAPHPHPFEGFLHSAEVVTAKNGKVEGGSALAPRNLEDHGDDHGKEEKKEKGVDTNTLVLVSALTFAGGVGLGLALYGRRLPASEGFDLSKWNPIQKAAGKQLYLDSALSGGSSKGVMGLASAFKVFDKGVIDGLLVEGPPKVVRAVGGLLTTLQSGFVRGYAALMQIGIIALVAYFAYVVSQRGGQ